MLQRFHSECQDKRKMWNVGLNNFEELDFRTKYAYDYWDDRTHWLSVHRFLTSAVIGTKR